MTRAFTGVAVVPPPEDDAAGATRRMHAGRAAALPRVTAGPATAASVADPGTGPAKNCPEWAEQLYDAVVAVAGREVVPAATHTADVDFQATRRLPDVSS